MPAKKSSMVEQLEVGIIPGPGSRAPGAGDSFGLAGRFAKEGSGSGLRSKAGFRACRSVDIPRDQATHDQRVDTCWVLQRDDSARRMEHFHRGTPSEVTDQWLFLLSHFHFFTNFFGPSPR